MKIIEGEIQKMTNFISGNDYYLYSLIKRNQKFEIYFALNYTEEQPFKEYYLYNGYTSDLQKIQMNQRALLEHIVVVVFMVIKWILVIKN